MEGAVARACTQSLHGDHVIAEPRVGTHHRGGTRGAVRLMVATLLRRARAKGGRALVRTVMLRVWPLSWLTLAYYRTRFTPVMWNRVLNRSCRSAWSRQTVSLTSVQQRAVRD